MVELHLIRGSSWEPIDLQPILDHPPDPLLPAVGQRDDGRGLFYRGRVNSVAGESESGKSWLLLATAAHEIRVGHSALYIDFEDESSSVVARLLALGVTAEHIKKRFLYVRPDERLPDIASLTDLVRERACSLVVIDGVTEAMGLEDLNLLDNADVAEFFRRLPTPLANASPAVVLIDHVVKKKQERGRYAIGAGHKLASITGVAYLLEQDKPFAVGRVGESQLIVTKDRPGEVRRWVLTRGKTPDYGIFQLNSQGSDIVTARVLADPRQERSSTRLDSVKEKILAAMGADEFPTKGEIKLRVGGNSQQLSDALKELTEGGLVSKDKPYRRISHDT